MSTVIVVAPDDIREARQVLNLTQMQVGIAFGGVRPETISRWENSSLRNRPRKRSLHTEIMSQFTRAAELLLELYPEQDDRQAFLNSRQRELQGRTPIEAMLQDSPYGIRDVVRLLGRMAEGIPT